MLRHIGDKWLARAAMSGNRSSGRTYVSASSTLKVPAATRSVSALEAFSRHKHRSGVFRVQSTPARSWSVSSRLICCGTTSEGGEMARAESNGDLGPINKPSIVMNDALYAYLLKHTREPPILRKIREETSTMRGSQMQTPPEQINLLTLLIELSGAKRAIEVGVFSGYSAVAIAMALPEDGKLVGCERDGNILNVARGFMEEAGLTHKVDLREGPGKDTLDELIAEGGTGQYDFVYIDADKRGYLAYYEQCLQLVRQGGLIVLDNVLWYGKTADPEVNDKQTVAIRELNDKLVRDERITFTILPVGDGVSLCRKR